MKQTLLGAQSRGPSVKPLKEVKYVQNIGRFEKGQSVADATFGPCTLVFGENGWGKSTELYPKVGDAMN